MLTEPKDVVIGAVRRDRFDRQIGPLRELPREQVTYERDVGVDLIGVHPRCGHDRIITGLRILASAWNR